jgi:phospholipid-binding lipoprotein MlaA
VAPESVRIGVSNFFHNLTTPIRLVGSLLQGKFKRAGIELGNFLINTTWGVAGFGKVTQQHPELNPPPEDVGQALGAWGIDHGIYLVWPFFGPSSLRDTVGLVGGYFLHPVTYVDPWSASSGIKAYDTVNETTFRIGNYEALKEAAIDPYIAIRDAYIQNRKKQVEE